MTKEHGTLTSVHPAWIASNTDPGAVGAHKVWRDTSVTPNVYRERNDADDAWDDLGSFSTGASPLLHVVFPFTFATPGLDTGVVVTGWTPAVDDVVYQPWIEVDTAWDGVTPLGDVVFQGQPVGLLYSGTGVPVDMTAADYDVGGFVDNLSHAIGRVGPVNGVGTFLLRAFPGRVTTAVPLTLIVTKDGYVTVQASITADAPPTSPLHVVAGVNDEFAFTPNGGAPETFTVAPGTYTGVGAIAAAMAGALGGSAEQFQTLVDLTDDGTSIILSGKGGASDNGDTITLGGNDVAAALGFTANPDTFAGGHGGDPGATQGAAVLHLLVLRA